MKIKLKINGEDVELTKDEARRIYDELSGVFGDVHFTPVVVPQYVPSGAPIPWSEPEYPWTKPTYPKIINCNGRTPKKCALN